nr:hypothetical protein Iba_chr13dCG11070 [Ipomoea batatas]
MSSGVVISPSLDFGEIICCQSLTARLIRLSRISIPKYKCTSRQNGSLRAPQCATTMALLYLTGCKFENRETVSGERCKADSKEPCEADSEESWKDDSEELCKADSEKSWKTDSEKSLQVRDFAWERERHLNCYVASGLFAGQGRQKVVVVEKHGGVGGRSVNFIEVAAIDRRRLAFRFDGKLDDNGDCSDCSANYSKRNGLKGGMKPVGGFDERREYYHIWFVRAGNQPVRTGIGFQFAGGLVPEPVRQTGSGFQFAGELVSSSPANWKPI